MDEISQDPKLNVGFPRGRWLDVAVAVVLIAAAVIAVMTGRGSRPAASPAGRPGRAAMAATGLPPRRCSQRDTRDPKQLSTNGRNFWPVPNRQENEIMTAKARTAMAPFTRRLHTMLLVLIAAIMVTLTVPAVARAAPSGPRGSAFVWANQPSAASYLPNPAYQWNSRHPFTAVNTITRTGVGSYKVRLPDLGAVSGTVLVTAYGSGANNCKVLSWGPSGTVQLVNVRCFTVRGVSADTPFTMSYANQTGVVGSDLAYVWANQPTAASYVPSQRYQANSSGATNQIQRLGMGSYLVKLPRLGRPAGHVQVTAYGPGSERCKVGFWGPNGTEQNIRVLCNTHNGTPVDTMFTLTYVRNGNVLGEPVCCRPDGNPTDYAWANQPTTASYTPNPLYQFTGFARQITISRLSTGSYAVKVPDFLTKGIVQVTAYGSNSAQCKVNFWTPAAGIRVLCFRSGSPIDTRFDVSFVGPFVVG